MTKVGLARMVAAAELPLILAIAPALLFPTPSRLVVLGVVPVIWLCARLSGGHMVPRTPLNASLFVLLGMLAVSVIATFDLRWSLGKVSGVVLGAVLFWAVARWVTTPSRLGIATAAFLLAGGGLAIIGLLGTNWGSKFSLLAGIGEYLPKAIRGVPGAETGFSPNAVAGCLVLFLPVQLTLLFGGGRQWLTTLGLHRERYLWPVVIQATLLALTGGTLLLTQSRGAWTGLIVATVALLARHKRRALALGVAVAAMGMAVIWALGADRLISREISPGLARTVSTRMEVWSPAIYGIQDFPFTGMGLNVFRKVMPVLYPPLLTSPHVDVPHAHNQALQTALDLGIPGLVSWAAIWLTVAFLLVRVHDRAPDNVHRALAAGLGAGLIAQFVFGITDAIPLGAKVGVLFWLTLALCVAVHQTALPLARRSIGSSAETSPLILSR